MDRTALHVPAALIRGRFGRIWIGSPSAVVGGEIIGRADAKRSPCVATSVTAFRDRSALRIICPLTPTIASARLTSVSICRSEEHTSELQSLMRISYAVFCLTKKNKHITHKLQSL